MSEKIKIQVKESAAKKAYPSIWYHPYGGDVFDVVESKKFPSFYEIAEGLHIGKLIDKSDVNLIVAIIKRGKPGRPKRIITPDTCQCDDPRHDRDVTICLKCLKPL